MTDLLSLTTERLILRSWRESDRDPFAVVNADRSVMEFMPALLTRRQSDEFFARIQNHWQTHSFGLCAVEHRDSGTFIGFTGMWIPRFDAPFMPAVEIGWRLASHWWGHGLATEAAREAVRYAFESLLLDALVSFTVSANTRSRRVMEKLGMTQNPADDFEHPKLPLGHPLRPHVLYRLARQDWIRGHPQRITANLITTSPSLS